MHPLLLLAILVFSLAIILLLGLYLVTARTVGVEFEGARSTVRTHQTTVAGLIAELGILIEAPDRVTPAGDTPLVDGMLVTIDKAHPVLIEVDGQRRRVLTHLTQPRDILTEAQITLRADDVIYVDGMLLNNAPYPKTPESLFITRARRVTLIDGDKTLTLNTVARTVGEALTEAKVSLYLADRVTPTPDSPLTDGSTIAIQRSIPIQIEIEGQVLNTRTAASTVKAALAESGLPIVGLDYTLPGEDDPATPNMRIQIVRVTVEIEVEQIDTPFKQITRTDTRIEPETRQIVQPGVPGLLERRTPIRKEKGVVVSRSEPQEIVIRTPQPEIVAIGATPSLIKPGQ